MKKQFNAKCRAIYGTDLALLMLYIFNFRKTADFVSEYFMSVVDIHFAQSQATNFAVFWMANSELRCDFKIQRTT